MKTCIEQHPICKASCCRVLKVNLTNPLNGRQAVMSKGYLMKDMQWYFKIRGASYDHRKGLLFFPLNNYIVEDNGDHLLLWRDCDLLEGNLCSGHPDNKPEFCKALDINNPKTITNKNYISEGCVLHEDYKEASNEDTQ